ncbi:MAG: iron ABC transporter substrate-binding protein, partial [Clostridiaceae bacterium]|nr:iron ABC transporter substrate-binding protein [Clostridiaceae bacterium]
MKKKFLAMTLVLVLALSTLVACGGSDDAGDTAPADNAIEEPADGGAGDAMDEEPV